MARTRDIVIGVILGGSFLVFFLFMAVFLLYSDFDGGPSFSGFGEKVALVNLYGEIVSSHGIVRQLDRWADDGDVMAIVLRIDSPGGGVAASQEIFEKVLRIKEETNKPIVISMGSVCASGGYYIAAAGDKIVANPGTLTGSIGVIIQWPIVGEMLDKIGIQYETIKSGDSKDVISLYREPTERDREILQAVVDDTYQQFVEVLVEQRGLSTSEVLEIADGSIFSGRQALEIGLIDELGTYEDAINLAGDMSGLGYDPDTITEKPKRSATIFDLMGNLLGIDLSSIVANHTGKVYPRLSYMMQ